MFNLANMYSSNSLRLCQSKLSLICSLAALNLSHPGDQAVIYPGQPYYQSCHSPTEIQARVSRLLTIPHILRHCCKLLPKCPSCLFQSINSLLQQQQHLSRVVLLEPFWHLHVVLKDWKWVRVAELQERKIHKVPEEAKYTRSPENLMEKSADKIGKRKIRLRFKSIKNDKEIKEIIAHGDKLIISLFTRLHVKF